VYLLAALADTSLGSNDVVSVSGEFGAKFWCRFLSLNSPQTHEDIQKTSIQARRW